MRRLGIVVVLASAFALPVACLVEVPPPNETPLAGAGGNGNSGGSGGVAGAGGTGPCSVGGEPIALGKLAFPTDSGIVNVKAAPYLAQGDGITDDTAALQQAISEHTGTNAILYFPAGTYLVSDSLRSVDSAGATSPYLTLQGAGRDETTIRLADAASGFGDAAVPKPVIESGVLPDGQGPRNYIYDLTVEVGANNAGAVGIDFRAHSSAGIARVVVRDAAGTAHTGLDLTRSAAGSRFIHHVRIEGFGTGIRVDLTRFGNTLEHVELINQRDIGLDNNDNLVVARRLTTDGSGVAVKNSGPNAMLALVEADLRGGDPNAAAIENSGALYARDVTTQGYGRALLEPETPITGTEITEYASSAYRLFGEASISLGLPIEETPVVPYAPTSDWANVVDHGAGSGGDDTLAIQAAIDAGKSTVYFPHGTYRPRKTIILRGAVRRVIGMMSKLEPADGHDFGNAAAPVPIFRLEDGSTTEVVIERFLLDASPTAPTPGAIFVEHASDRTLLLSDITAERDDRRFAYRSVQGAGTAFLENLSAGALSLEVSGQRVFARALNGDGQFPTIDNAGAWLWVLGYKVYGPDTVTLTRSGGRTELIGGYFLPLSAPPAVPAHVIEQAEASFVYATSAGDDPFLDYGVQVRETRGVESLQLLRSEVAKRKEQGSLVPLFAGHQRSVRVCHE